MVLVRSTLFFLLSIVNTIFWGIVTVPASFIHSHVGYDLARCWGVCQLWLSTHVCGIRYTIAGREHIPSTPCISMAKHQSAWETVFILCHIPRAVWIIKKELVWLPIIGWVLHGIRSIAIDRKSGKAAIEQIVEQGRERIAEGWWISIFPEGTRVAPKTRGSYRIGGAILAARTGAPILPIAHNAGECWPRYSFMKYPGTVTVTISPVIPTQGRDPADLIAEVERVIEGAMDQMKPARA